MSPPKENSRLSHFYTVIKLLIIGSSCVSLIRGDSLNDKPDRGTIDESIMNDTNTSKISMTIFEKNKKQQSIIQNFNFDFKKILKNRKERSPNSNIRGSTSQKTAYHHGRVSNLLRRVYGEENAHVRRAINEIEESTYRSQTGLRSDPNFFVPYENHPYEAIKNRQWNETTTRKLEETETFQEEDEPISPTGAFRSIRITAITDAMDEKRDSTNSAQIDFLKQKVIPRTIAFWQSALLVVPVSSNLVINKKDLANRLYCGDSEFTEVPNAHLTEGIPDTDLVLYISAQPSTRFCGPSTLAVAVACNFDQYDRPIAGAVNFCLDQVDLDENGGASESITQDNVDVAIHEAAHVLAMSSNSYRFFYDSETGQPRTRRPFASISVTCVNGEDRTLIVPGEDTLKFFKAGSNQQLYAAIVTPKVLAVARNQFDCQDIEGAPLENQPTGTQSCTGDHWEERLFYPEALSGVISPTTNILSPLTLALMEDSGWYMANYSFAQVSPWGHGAGCDFVFKNCLDTSSGDAEVPEFGRGYFCNKANSRGCSPSHTHKMACTVIDYSLYFPPNPPPDQFRYFPNDLTLGGPRQADFCPLYGSTYGGLNAEQLDCGIDANRDILNIFGEYYGEQSKCFETSTGEGRCYQAQCIKSERVLKVGIRNTWETCTHDFQEIPIKSASGVFDGTLICPRLSSVCPDLFCPANCAGRGVCDFQYQVNGTTQPKCICFNESDTSPGCSETLILDGLYLENSNLLQDLLSESFFDPLIAIFVDHPNTWNAASWFWAGGLLFIILLVILSICSSIYPAKPKARGGIRSAQTRRQPYSTMSVKRYDGTKNSRNPKGTTTRQKRKRRYQKS